ncbi:hypothetical protein EJ08DRAFT_271382 [Tothia fuscella]|uniref:Uncharacterized protein n=1 Tax=Tothia fuscella TaxID=1048955 RepID=A0A9P4NQ78_9PEZI|nr:hypothetical protein EJ08DRAFT_271382 [Tothia fuscella]
MSNARMHSGARCEVHHGKDTSVSQSLGPPSKSLFARMSSLLSSKAVRLDLYRKSPNENCVTNPAFFYRIETSQSTFCSLACFTVHVDSVEVSSNAWPMIGAGLNGVGNMYIYPNYGVPILVIVGEKIRKNTRRPVVERVIGLLEECVVA